jgi:endonuclease/exonuclease/phosphatase family metal-dependent hydrolase
VTVVVLIFVLASAALLLSELGQGTGQKPELEGYRGADVKDAPVTVAAWNMQRFGPDKAGNTTLLYAYADKIRRYDIVFLQEITDASNESFPLLCSLLVDYNCINSSKAGRTSYTEQYVIAYKKELSLLDYKDWNPDPLDRWERPPFEAKFNFGQFNMTFFVLHAKPSDVKKELRSLENALVTESGNIAVIGDLNADCDYYSPASANSTEFDRWLWVMPDSEDTTVSQNTHCAYDRIILNDGATSRFAEYGVDRNVTSDMSDHYLVWMKIS